MNVLLPLKAPRECKCLCRQSPIPRSGGNMPLTLHRRLLGRYEAPVTDPTPRTLSSFTAAATQGGRLAELHQAAPNGNIRPSRSLAHRAVNPLCCPRSEFMINALLLQLSIMKKNRFHRDHKKTQIMPTLSYALSIRLAVTPP